MKQSEKDKVRSIVDLKNASAEARTNLESKIAKWYQLYDQVLPTDSVYPWRSKVFVPELQKVFDTIHPLFMGMLFGQELPFKTKGVSGDIDKARADALNELIKVYIDKMDLYGPLDDYVKEQMVIGTAFGKLTWKKIVYEYEEEIEEEIPQTIDVMGQQVPTGETKTRTKKATKQKTVKDSPDFEWISWKDLFFSARATNLNDSWKIHRSYATISELEQVNAGAIDQGLEPIYKNLKELKKLTIDATETLDNSTQIGKDQKEEIGLHTDLTDKAKHVDNLIKLNEYGEVELLEYWSQDGKYVDTVAASTILIREAENPYKHKSDPFLYSNYIKRPGEVWGKGVCELCEDSIDYLNTVVNQSIDSNSLADNLMLIVSRDAGINLDEVKARPGGVVNVDIEPTQTLAQVVQQLKFSKIDTTVEQAIAREDIRDVTGASRFMQGSFESGAVRSGTQQRAIMAAGGKKFIGKILTFEHMFLKPFVRKLYALIGQYMTEDVAVRILDDKQKAQLVTLTYEEIIEDVDFIPMGSRQLLEMEIIVHQFSTLLSVSAGIPNGQMLVNYAYLLRKIAENLGVPQDELNQVILNPEEQKKAMIQSMMLNGGMEGMGGETTGPGQPNTGGGNNI